MTADALIDQELAIGILIIGAGLLLTAFPGLFATMDETFDAVGSTRSDVEPTWWRVQLTRIVGVGIVLAGGWFLVTTYRL